MKFYAVDRISRTRLALIDWCCTNKYKTRHQIRYTRCLIKTDAGVMFQLHLYQLIALTLTYIAKCAPSIRWMRKKCWNIKFGLEFVAFSNDLASCRLANSNRVWLFIFTRWQNHKNIVLNSISFSGKFYFRNIRKIYESIEIQPNFNKPAELFLRQNILSLAKYPGD